jgi:hypothetical protein
VLVASPMMASSGITGSQSAEDGERAASLHMDTCGRYIRPAQETEDGDGSCGVRMR